MKLKTSSSTLSVFVFAFAFGVGSILGNVPATFSPENPEAARIRVEDVSPYSWEFLSGTKTSPAFDFGNGLTLRMEVEEPSDDNEVMNAARKAIGETPEVMEAAKKKLAALLKNDDDLNAPWENDAWLVRFLRLRNYDVPKTYQLIRSYYAVKNKHREIFKNLVPSEMREVAELSIIGMLPNRDPAGSRIGLIGLLRNWDPEKTSLVQLVREAMVFAETAAYEPATQLAGVQIIFDAGGFTWQQMKQFNPKIAKFMIQWILKSAPIKIQGIHILNESRLSRTLVNMFKPFMTEEMRDKIHFHGTNVRSLYKYIPAKSLPNILGGPFSKPVLSSYEWSILLQSADEEIAKIGSYGLKPKA